MGLAQTAQVRTDLSREIVFQGESRLQLQRWHQMRVLNCRSVVVNRDGVLGRMGWARTARFASFYRVAIVFGIIAIFLVSEVLADTHTAGVPVLNSLPDAPYTLYLDFAGFNFTGGWGGTASAPGNTPAFENASASGSFNTSQQNNIKQVWARVAQSYTPFHINVTTVDPAVAADKADTDAHRQAYYDLTPRMMHTVIGHSRQNNLVRSVRRNLVRGCCAVRVRHE